MEHTNPTLYAKTQGSGIPCQLLAGEMPGAILQASNTRLEQACMNTQGMPEGLTPACCTTCELSHAERLQLSESARFSMDEEIAMLRKMIKNFTRAASTSGEDDYPDNLAKSLDLLGLTCSRLASVLRVTMALSGSQDDDLRKQIETSLASFISETQVTDCAKPVKKNRKQKKEAKDV